MLSPGSRRVICCKIAIGIEASMTTSPDSCTTWAWSSCSATPRSSLHEPTSSARWPPYGWSDLEHVILFNGAGLYRQVKSFAAYYQEWRTHLSVAKDSAAGSVSRQNPDESGYPASGRPPSP